MKIFIISIIIFALLILISFISLVSFLVKEIEKGVDKDYESYLL